MRVDVKDLVVGEIYISLRDDFEYITIDKISYIRGDGVYKRSWFHKINSDVYDYDRMSENIIFESVYTFYEFRDCFLEEDLKPYHSELLKLVEYFESFPENRIYSRKRKLEILGGL